MRADITIGQYNIDLFPIEDDILSMEMDNIFRELYLEGDTTSLSFIAGSIGKLQTLFGVIPNIKGIGKMSEKVVNKLFLFFIDVDYWLSLLITWFCFVCWLFCGIH